MPWMCWMSCLNWCNIPLVMDDIQRLSARLSGIKQLRSGIDRCEFSIDGMGRQP